MTSYDVVDIDGDLPEHVRKQLEPYIKPASALNLQPVRSELGDTPTKGGESHYYGGVDKYADVGTTDAEIATNLYIAKTILGGIDPKTGQPRRSDWSGEILWSERAQHVMVTAARKAIEAQADAIPDYVQESGLRKAHDADRFVLKGFNALRGEARAKALTSTGSGTGDEWVPTFAASELWRDVHLATEVAPNVRRVNMPTNPYDLPTEISDVTYYYASTENTSVTGSNPGTGKATLSAKKIQADVSFSGELTEDSIVPAVPSIRQNLVRRGAQTIDDLIVHGDTETAGTGNINSDDQAASAGFFPLAMNGMRKFCLVTNTGQVDNLAGAVTATNYLTLRNSLGKYGARPSDLVLVTGYSTHGSMLDIEEFQTIDKYGPNATVIRGELGRFFGTPLVLSEAIPGLSSDKVAADGKADAATPANNTTGWLLLFNKSGWTIGFRREFNIETDRNIQTDTNILVGSFRMALIPSGIATTHTAVARNITVL